MNERDTHLAIPVDPLIFSSSKPPTVAVLSVVVTIDQCPV